MKKILYFALLAAELFVGMLLLSALWNSAFYIPIAVAVVALVVMLTWQIILLVKATEGEVKRRIMQRIAFVMLIPTAVFVATYIIVAVAFIIAFAFDGF